MLALPALTGRAEPTLRADEYEVRAAAVLNLAKFVTWPSTSFQSDLDPLVISVVGSRPLADVFQSINGKKVRGRRVRVLHARDASSQRNCHILYIEENHGVAPQVLQEDLFERHVLIVSERGAPARISPS